VELQGKKRREGDSCHTRAFSGLHLNYFAGGFFAAAGSLPIAFNSST
jgi:hypothetical protein